MKKFLTVLLIFGNLFFASTVNAETETYTGKGKATMGESETQEQIIERAKTYALRNAREKAGVYIKTKSRLKDFELVEDDIITLASGVLKITDTQIEKTLVNDTIQVFMTVTVIIDSDELKQNIDDFINSHGNVNIPVDAVKFNYNGHRYKVIDTGLTWTDAKAYCESLGGYLVTITSGVEQAFIEKMLRNYSGKYFGFWLGAEKKFGAWQWVTGENLNYTKFANGEPNDSGNYLQIYGRPPIEYEQYYAFGYWDDTTPDGTNSGVLNEHAFICEWDS